MIWTNYMIYNWFHMTHYLCFDFCIWTKNFDREFDKGFMYIYEDMNYK